MSEAFLTFWSAYPRKVGKLAAWRAWQRHVRDDAETVAAIHAVLAWQVPLWAARGEPEYVPHPQTWINQGRFYDEEPAPQPSLTAKTNRTLQAAASLLRRVP